MPSRFSITANITVYGISHALVDASCGALIFGGLAFAGLNINSLASLIVLYNVLAFAMEAPLGLLADHLKAPAAIASSGCLITALSFFFIKLPAVSICLAGTGNALFHVGGGINALGLKPGKASMPGIFVAPGALGLLLGNLSGKLGFYTEWPFVVLLAAASLSIILVKSPKNIYIAAGTNRDMSRLEVIIILLLASIALRSLVGLALDFPWKSNIYLLIALTLAVVLGKGLGGVISDRLGWARVTIFGLIISSVLISFGLGHPYLAIPGVFLFNMTMPVTLTAVSEMLPGRPGFSFGLTTLALIAGAFPAFTELKGALYNGWIVLVMVLASAFILYTALKLYYKSSGEHIKLVDRFLSSGNSTGA